MTAPPSLADQLRAAAGQLKLTADEWQDKIAIMPTLHAQQMALVTLLLAAAARLDALEQQLEQRDADLFCRADNVKLRADLSACRQALAAAQQEAKSANDAFARLAGKHTMQAGSLVEAEAERDRLRMALAQALDPTTGEPNDQETP